MKYMLSQMEVMMGRDFYDQYERKVLKLSVLFFVVLSIGIQSGLPNWMINIHNAEKLRSQDVLLMYLSLFKRWSLLFNYVFNHISFASRIKFGIPTLKMCTIRTFLWKYLLM